MTRAATSVEFYWLVELRPAFDGHPPFPATYYAGYREDPLGAAKTTDPNACPKWARKEDAEKVAEKLGGTLSCIWQAVEHGFESAAAVNNIERVEAERDALQTEVESLRPDAEIGRRWQSNSSLEEWFPITAEEIVRLRSDSAAKDARIAELDGALRKCIGHLMRDASTKEAWADVNDARRSLADRAALAGSAT
jgi:hypothetical protein